MKKISIALVLSFLMINVAFSQNRSIKFEEPNFKKALAKAKKENKKLFVDCYTTWCGPCKMMAKEVFTNDEVADYFNNNYINLKLDMEKEGIEFGKKYQIAGYPTFFILDGDGVEICKISGSSEPNEFIKAIELGGKPEFSTDTLTQQYEKGERSMEFINNYLTILKSAGEYEKSDEVLKSIRLFTSEADIKDATRWLIFNKFQNKYENEDVRFFIDNIEKFESIYQTKVDYKLDELYGLKVVDFVYFEAKFPGVKFDSSQFDNFIAEIQMIGYEKASTTLSIALVERLIRNGEYLKAAELITNVRDLKILNDQYFGTYFGMIFFNKLFKLTKDVKVLKILNDNLDYLLKIDNQNPELSSYKAQISELLR